MTVRAIDLRKWPGRGGQKPWDGRRRFADRLASHPGLVHVATAERYVTPERWGLSVDARFIGRSVTDVRLAVEDTLCRRDLRTFRGLLRWAGSQRIKTPLGSVPVEVVTRSQLFDPDVGVVTTTAYTGGGWWLTADEGRTLGLSADWWRAAQDERFRDGWTLGLPGWGAPGEWLDGHGRHHQGWQASLQRPVLKVAALGGHGLRAEWGKAGQGGWTRKVKGKRKRVGHWEKVGGRLLPFRGRIADLIGPAFALDGLDTGELAEHLTEFELPALDVPAAVEVSPDGAGQLLDVALAMHKLAVALDAEAARWFTTRAQQRDGIAVVGLLDLVSPGSLASTALRQAGLEPPLLHFNRLDDAALDDWTAACHGGWTE